MDFSGAGTAIMLAVAAGLWFLYLVPTWVRRREYLATERSATRIQQTMRIMAETAEMPDQVRFAVTARDAARAERLLRAQQRREDAETARRVRAERAATPRGPIVKSRPAPLPKATADAVRRARMRRSRAVASLVMIAATVVGLVQGWLIIATGTSVAGTVVLVASLVAGGVSIGLHAQLSARTLAMRVAARDAEAASRRSTGASMPAGAAPRIARETPVRRDPAPWTPVPVPQPLYLSKPAPQRIDVTPVPVVQAAPVKPAAPVVPIRATEPAASAAPVSVAPAPPLSRWARMGVLDDLDTAAPDLDDMLRRRRAAG